MNILAKITRRGFIRDIATLATGTVGAQIITMSLIPIITRQYGPEAYGLMGIFMSVLAVIIPLASLTYPIAIVLPKESSEAIVILKVSLKISLILSAVSLIILILFNKNIAKILNLSSIPNLLYLIPIVIITASTSQVLRQWMIRCKQYKPLSKITFFEPLITYGGMLVVGFFYPVEKVLIYFIASKSLINTVLLLLSAIKKNDSVLIEFKKKDSNLFLVLKKYRDFPLYRAPQELINTMSQNLPVLLLASLFGPGSAGFYSIARMALSLPTLVIGNAVGDVFYPRISEARNNNENIESLLKRASMLLFFIGLVPFGIVICFGPYLFGLVFGDEWIVSGQYARWLSIWLLFNFANRACFRALPVLSAQGFHLKFTILTLVIRALALFTGLYFFQSDLIAIAIFGVTGAISEILLSVITIRISKSFNNKITEMKDT